MTTCPALHQIPGPQQVCWCTCDCGQCVADFDAYFDIKEGTFSCWYCHGVAGHLPQGAEDLPEGDWAALGRFPRGQVLDPVGAVWANMAGATKEHRGIVHRLHSRWPRPTQARLKKSIPGYGAIADIAPDEDEDYALAWQPRNLTDFWNGDHQPITAHMLPRTDGHNLLYKGATHSFLGEYESGKTWAALGATRSVLADGGSVLYLDADSTAETVVPRLKRMGVSREIAAEQFVYVEVQDSPNISRAVRDRYLWFTRQEWNLVVIDGVTDAMAVMNLDPNAAKDVSEWSRTFTRPFRKAGAAVVIIDHVKKSDDPTKPQRGAQGSQQKSASMDVTYTIIAQESPKIGDVGHVDMYVGKDRLGYIRQHAASEQGRMQMASRITIDSTDDDKTSVTFEKPTEEMVRESGELSQSAYGGDAQTATGIMRLLAAKEGLTRKEVIASVCAQGATQMGADRALTLLVTNGEVRKEHKGQGVLHFVTRPEPDTGKPNAFAYSDRIFGKRWDEK